MLVFYFYSYDLFFYINDYFVILVKVVKEVFGNLGGLVGDFILGFRFCVRNLIILCFFGFFICGGKLVEIIGCVVC